MGERGELAPHCCTLSASGQAWRLSSTVMFSVGAAAACCSGAASPMTAPMSLSSIATVCNWPFARARFTVASLKA